MALTRDRILAQAEKYELREVHIPAWADESGDDVVLVRGLSAKEWDAHQASTRIYQGTEEVGIDNGNVTAKLICRCIVDANGQRLLKDQDADKLGDLPITELDRLGSTILELSGLTAAAREAMEGNSVAAPSGETSSESPASTDGHPTSSSRDLAHVN